MFSLNSQLQLTSNTGAATYNCSPVWSLLNVMGFIGRSLFATQPEKHIDTRGTVVEAQSRGTAKL